jgi:hypothetical protein
MCIVSFVLWACLLIKFIAIEFFMHRKVFVFRHMQVEDLS